MQVNDFITNKLVDCFYRIDKSINDALPYPLISHNGESFVALTDTIGNFEPMIRHFEQRAALQPQFIAAQVFDYRIWVNADTAEFKQSELNQDELKQGESTQNWQLFDPEMDYAPINHWMNLHKVLELCGLTIFGDEEIKINFDLLTDFRRFEFQLELQRRNQIDYLVVRHRTLESTEPRLKELFALLSRRPRPELHIPLVMNRALGELQPHLRETVAVYPLAEFARQIKTCLARAVIAHHYIYFRLIEQLIKISQKTLGGRPFHSSDLLSFHLINYYYINLDRAQLLRVIRRFYPNFDFHPLLANTYLSKVEWREKSAAQTPSVDEETIIGERIDLTLKSADEQTIVNLSVTDNLPELQQYLNYINCELHFINYQITNKAELSDQSLSELAILIAENIEELRGTWAVRSSANEVDYKDFWRRQVWNYGHNAKSVISTAAFRYALYDPPYGGASETLQQIIDDELITLIFGDEPAQQNFRIFRVDPGASDYFINEWWDFLWIAFNLEVGKVLVILGTATD